MRKISILAAFIAIAAAIFTSCQQKDIVIDVAALADDLKSSVPFVDTLEQPSDAYFSQFYEIDKNDISAKKIYVSAATAEEIAVFEAKDSEAAARIREAVDTHIADNLESFENYDAEAQKRLNDPVIVQKGKYVILCVSDDNDAALKCIDKYTK